MSTFIRRSMTAIDVPYTKEVKPSLKQAIDIKMKVLREFHVVDKNNEAAIRKELKDAVDANPKRDYEIVLDQVAHKLIMARLNR